jgi:hypothetical protein
VTAVAAAAAVALPLAGGSTGRLLGAGPDAERAVLWGYQVVLVLIAVGLLVDLLRGRWARAVVTRLVVDLGERAETGTLQARLAHALGDRSLAIAYWLPEANGYVDERGDRVVLPGAGSGRAVTVIEQRASGSRRWSTTRRCWTIPPWLMRWPRRPGSPCRTCACRPRCDARSRSWLPPAVASLRPVTRSAVISSKSYG